ncbi:MAG TPA: tetratricopeptide repeat protein [Candidatus Limisoma gallistercoris]|nr:tetratricopeptide repeat protein [Candidatus Limisoma gallistercoris]
MRRIIFGFVLVGIAVSAVAQMLMQPSAGSDALFAAGVDLYNAGKYREAIPLFAKSDSLDKAQINPSSNRRDYSSMWLASCYYKLGDTATAASINANYRFAPVDRRLTVKSDSLSQIGMEYCNQGDYAKAADYLIQCAEIEKSLLGDSSVWYCNSLWNIGDCYYQAGDLNNALKYNEVYVNMVRNICGKLSQKDVISTANLGLLYHQLSLCDSALNCFIYAYDNLDSLDLNKQYLAYHIANEYNIIASEDSTANKIDLLQKARSYLKKTDANDSIIHQLHTDVEKNIALCLSDESVTKYNNGEYSGALLLAKEVSNIFAQTLGKRNIYYASSLTLLSKYETSLGNYTDAIRFAEEALNIQENISGIEHPYYAAALNNLAMSNSCLGNYFQAISLGEKALNIFMKSYGKSITYATSLDNLAYYYSKSGDDVKAIFLGTEALDIRKKLLGKNDLDYAMLLNNLANYNSNLGNYAEAIRLGSDALTIYEKAFGKEHPDCAVILSNLADFNALSNNYSEAIRLVTEALNIQGKTFGKNHIDYALSLSNLATYNYGLKNYAEAIRLELEALRIVHNMVGNNNPEYAVCLSHLSKYNYYLGNYSEAIRLGTEALNILENTLGKNHISTTKALENLATYNWKIGNADAVGYCVEATEALSGIVRRTFADLTARERNLFWDKYKAWFEGTVHGIAYDMPSDSLVENGYNGALLAKGLLLNSEIELSTLLKESGDEEVANIYNNLKNLRLQINKLYEKPVAERQLDTDSLERAAQGLERQLVQRSKAYGDYTANLVIDWRQVQQKLGDGDMAVEFVSFPMRNDSVMYAAYCLRKGMASPKMVPLFEERQLTSIDKRLYLSSPMLYNLVWKPLEREMERVTTVYFAPSGELYNLPIESLPIDGSTYNSDLRGYRRLSSTRQLVLRRDGVEVTKAAVYGGLKYDTDTVTLANDSRKYRTAEPVQWSSRAVADSLNLRDGVYELPATKIEAEDIDKALESAKIDTELYTDTIGTEASFKALSGSGVNALHIATHGFYWTEREVSRLDNLAFLNDDMPAAVQEDKALTRSGLLLAGANTALKGLPLPEGVEDGVLTAKEIAGMDLRRLDLVALSACQTGLGEITGDGVFGLQRGFKKAGANTLLMSLWKVDDTATQLLMTQFYKNMLSGMGKYEALTAAQKYLRELEVEVKPEKTAFQQIMDGKDGKKEKNPGSRTVRKYANPYYWAAFVLLDGVD